MNLSRTILCMLLTVIAVAVHGSNYQKVMFEMSDGSTRCIGLDSPSMHLSFAAANLVVSHPHVMVEDQSFPVSKIRKITYSKIPDSGIKDVAPDKNGITVLYSPSSIEVKGVNDETRLNLRLMDLSGEILYNGAAAGNYTLGRGTLSTGVYLFSVNGRTLKIAVK